MTKLAALVALIGLGFLAPISAGAQPGVGAAIAELGGLSIREVNSDICLPATSAEYDALGKNAVLKLTSSSAHVGELPLKSVYLAVEGTRVPLQRVAVLAKTTTSRSTPNGPETYFTQVSFYLLPVYFLKQDAALKVDFGGGQRTEFGVTSFSDSGDHLNGAPTFIRADDNVEPSEPDMSAVQRLLLVSTRLTSAGQRGTS